MRPATITFGSILSMARKNVSPLVCSPSAKAMMAFVFFCMIFDASILPIVFSSTLYTIPVLRVVFSN